LTFVQENIQWFDEPEINFYLDIHIVIIINDEKWWDKSEEDSIVFGNVKYLNKAKLKKYFQYQNMCRPLYLGIETVNICNLKCIICPCNKMTRKRELMDMDLFKKIVSDYCEIGGGDVSLTPVGGDIFLDKYLPERINHLKNQNKIRDIGFITNAIAASRFSDEDLRFIINSTYRIDISIYGLNEEEYSTITRTNGNYDKMIESARRIVSFNEKSLIVFGFRFLINHSQTEIEQWIINNFKKKIPFGYTLEYGNWGGEMNVKTRLPYDAKWLPVQKNTKKMPCHFPLASTKVFLNGDVKFCLCIDYNNDIPENTIGNIKHERLIDIYNGVKARHLWRHGFSKCKICTFKTIPLINFIGEDFFPYMNKPLRFISV
jgi:MoaA/NifB/PqqE/SkfB family radical SAM enzyme